MENQNNQQQEITHFTNKQIRKDFMIISSFVYTLSKQPSKTDLEFEAKYDVYSRLMRAHNNWGRGTQIGTLGLFMTYCFKGHSVKLKLLGGILYTSWLNHFFTLGSYCGLVYHLPSQMKKLNMGLEYETCQITQKFTQQIIQRQEKESQGEKVLTDRILLNNFYASNIHKEELSSIQNKSRVKNDYFEKNKHKYMKQGENDTDESHIFVEKSAYEDELKLKYLDSFITRYAYHSFSRWAKRVGCYLRIIDEY